MTAPAADPLPLAAWTVLIAKAAALGFITPEPDGPGPFGFRTADPAAGGLA
ncbi:hypothetical protein [Rhodococcoides fascians]|uniref:hypothetical protein n=1 Tax=Rhodococcoides fascians TaxID=1828 RepID=UPI000A427387|nr:hypothetical protein [Rhodococcus fascians]